MLHLGNDDFVAFMHLTFAERAGYQVDSLGGTASKHNLLYLAGIDKATYFLAGSLVQIGSLLREIVNTTMYVSIHIEILIAHSIKYTQWFLCCSRVVKINQWFLINLAR